MLAVVVDDFDMGVTHVIRGDDHLNNAFRQLAIIRAMDWPIPVMPMFRSSTGFDGAKLSKRHGALGVDAYRDELGILPEAAVQLFASALAGGPWRLTTIISPRAGGRMVRQSTCRQDAVALRREEARENLNGHYIREAGRRASPALVRRTGSRMRNFTADPRYAGMKAGAQFNDWPRRDSCSPSVRWLDEKAAALLTRAGPLSPCTRAPCCGAAWEHERDRCCSAGVAERNSLKLGNTPSR
jgi:hypothetical protein